MSRPTSTEDLPLWRLPVMRWLVLVSLLGFSSFCLTLASLPSWALSGGVGAGAAGLVTTVMLASTVLTQTAVPAVVSRLGVGPTLVGGLLALGVPAPFLALSHELGWLLAVSAVRGLGFAVLTVVGATLTATVAAPGRHGESVGLYGLAIALPNLLAVPAGVALTQAGAFAWVAGLAAAPVLAIPGALALGRAAATPAPEDLPVIPAGATAVPSSGLSATPPAERARRAGVRSALPPSVVLFVVTLAGGGLVTFLPIGRPTGTLATIALVLFGATAALARWRAGVLADRVGSRVLLPLSLTAATVGLAMVAVGLSVGTGADLTAEVVLLVGAMLFGAGYGAVQNLTLVIAFAAAGPDRTAAASAIWNTAFDAGTGVGAVAVGAVAATGLGLSWAFALSAALIALTLPPVLARVRRPRRSAQQAGQRLGRQM